jgi:hypothetical protein
MAFSGDAEAPTGDGLMERLEVEEGHAVCYGGRGFSGEAYENSSFCIRRIAVGGGVDFRRCSDHRCFGLRHPREPPVL